MGPTESNGDGLAFLINHGDFIRSFREADLVPPGNRHGNFCCSLRRILGDPDRAVEFIVSAAVDERHFRLYCLAGFSRRPLDFSNWRDVAGNRFIS